MDYRDRVQKKGGPISSSFEEVCLGAVLRQTEKWSWMESVSQWVWEPFTLLPPFPHSLPSKWDVLEAYGVQTLLFHTCLCESFSLQERSNKALGEQLLLSLPCLPHAGDEDTGRAQRRHFYFLMCLAHMPETATSNCSPSSSELEHLHLSHAKPGIFFLRRERWLYVVVARQPGSLGAQTYMQLCRISAGSHTILFKKLSLWKPAIF